jgi:hypothetical protein
MHICTCKCTRVAFARCCRCCRNNSQVRETVRLTCRARSTRETRVSRMEAEMENSSYNFWGRTSDDEPGANGNVGSVEITAFFTAVKDPRVVSFWRRHRLRTTLGIKCRRCPGRGREVSTRPYTRIAVTGRFLRPPSTGSPTGNRMPTVRRRHSAAVHPAGRVSLSHATASPPPQSAARTAACCHIL